MHIACLTENYDALSALLLAGADVNISNTKHMDPVINTSSLFRLYIKDQPNFLKHRNIKCGGTPLHWATCADEIHKIIEYNCDINAVNFENRFLDKIFYLYKKFYNTLLQNCVTSNDTM